MTFARAELEPELANDPMLGAVGWSWLTDALDGRARSATPPRPARSPGWSPRASPGWPTGRASVEMEVRASWTPRGRRRRRPPRRAGPTCSARSRACHRCPRASSRCPGRGADRAAAATVGPVTRSTDPARTRRRRRAEPLDPAADERRPEPAAVLIPLDMPADGVPDVVVDERAPDGGGPGHRRRRGPGRPRRRAGLGLPLRPARLPRAAAPRGLRHLADRPDRLPRPRARSPRPSATPSGSCTPPPRTCPASREVGPAPGAAVRHRARRAPARPAPGRPRPPSSSTTSACRLAKEHSAVDWSTRPLPEPWLRYAALDVEVLVERPQR